MKERVEDHQYSSVINECPFKCKISVTSNNRYSYLKKNGVIFHQPPHTVAV